jgi:glycerol kinase
VAVLSIDAGTTGVTALVVDVDGQIISKSHTEFSQHFPRSGWVEHDPEEIWQATLKSARLAIEASGTVPTALGITNQRETVVLWDKDTLRSPRNAIVWQDRRTANLVLEIRNSGKEEQIREKTGLGLDPYFSSSKLLWIAKNEPEIWNGVVSGQVLIGTVDSYLVARLTAGRRHVTDASNASRTQLMDISSGSWDDELLDIFRVPKSRLPEIVPTYGLVDKTSADAFLGLQIPISGIAGDQQAALFGQAAFEVGDNKCTYGTGAFILSNTGRTRVASSHGLLSTIAWQSPTGEITYALEGSVFIAGAAVQWLRDGLQVIETAAEVEALARSVSDTNGLVFVPALTGLGAPHWDPYARGTMFGITRGTTSAHLARATLQAIAFQVRAVVDAMSQDTKIKLTSLRADGGAAANNLLMEMQADSLKIPVIRGKNLESTGLGAAFLAGIGTGIWSSKQELKEVFQVDRVFDNKPFDEWNFVTWQRAVKISRGWAHQGEN